MSIQDTFTRATQALEDITLRVKNQADVWKNAVDLQVQRLETWKNDFLAKNGTNNGLPGATHFNVAHAVYKGSGHFSGFVHIKLPFTTETKHMFLIGIRGHCYGQASIIEASFAGYYYNNIGVVNPVLKGSDDPYIYMSKDGFIVCRISLSSVYYTTVAVDAMQVANNPPFKKGDIEIQINNIEKI